MAALVISAKYPQLPCDPFSGLSLHAGKLSCELSRAVPHGSKRVLHILSQILALAREVEPHAIEAVVKLVDWPAQRLNELRQLFRALMQHPCSLLAACVPVVHENSLDLRLRPCNP